jgi:hypothetical protein
MNPLLFLGGALGVFLLVSFFIWLFQRERKKTFNSSIEDFRSQLDAIAPRHEDKHR